jgi:hypothetical protein
MQQEKMLNISEMHVKGKWNASKLYADKETQVKHKWKTGEMQMKR